MKAPSAGSVGSPYSRALKHEHCRGINYIIHHKPLSAKCADRNLQTLAQVEETFGHRVHGGEIPILDSWKDLQPYVLPIVVTGP